MKSFLQIAGAQFIAPFSVRCTASPLHILLSFGRCMASPLRVGWVLLALMGINIATAQDTWTVVLYDSINGGIVRVDGNGAVLEQVTLPKNENSAYPQRVAFDETGTNLAYINYGEPPVLRIIGANEVLLPLPPDTTGNSLAFDASTAVFSPDGTRFAYGHSRAQGEWQIDVLDTATGTSTATLTHESAVATGFSPGKTPIVQSLDAAGTVRFVLAEAFSGFQSNFSTSYIWDTAANTVMATNIPAALDGDIRNGERLTLLFDETLPNNADAFPYPQANAMYFTGADGTRSLLFSTANVSLFWARFIAGGQYVLVGSFSPENRISWLILDRAGTVIGDFPPLQMTGVRGTADGFVYTVDAGANGGSILYRVTVDANGASDPLELWSSPAGVAFSVMWAG